MESNNIDLAKSFLLYPANREFIQGKSRKITGSTPLWRLAVGFWLPLLLFVTIQSFFTSTAKSNLAGINDQWRLGESLKTNAILASPVLLILPVEIRSRRRNQRLVQHGVLVQGLVTSSQPSWLSSKFGMDVEYAFTAPDGQQCYGKETYLDIAPLLLGRESNIRRPKPSKPVVVLYADNKTFRML